MRRKDKYLIYLMDGEAILYNQSFEKVCTLPATFEEAEIILNNYLKSKIYISLLIDQNHQDIQEEKLPPLFPWDLLRLLHYKKASCAVLGGYGGFQFFRQNKETYLRWVHIPEKDARTHWISWTLNHSGQVSFAALEGRNFLNHSFPSPKKYQLLSYSLPSQKIRHVVFQGKRILLSRLPQGEEEVKSSLHFLSRPHPDVYDDIDIINLDEKGVPSYPYGLIEYIASQRKSSFCLHHLLMSKSLWIRKGMGGFLSLLLLWMGVEVYESFDFKQKNVSLLSDNMFLKRTTEVSLLPSKDTPLFHRAVDQFTFLKFYLHDPLKDFEQLAQALKAHPIHLESLIWSFNNHREITLSLSMEGETQNSLPEHFETLLSSLRDHFPKCQIQVIQAPYNSSPHETYKSSSEDSRPLVTLQVKFP
jgi:hypothetical protein